MTEKELVDINTAFEAVNVPECCGNCAFFYLGGHSCIAANGLEFECAVKKTDCCSRWRKKH